MLVIAAKPGPVPRGARSTILVLFSLLVFANTVAAGRLVVLVLNGSKLGGQTLEAKRLLIAAGLVLLANIITFGLLYWELDSGGPRGRVGPRPSTRTSSSRRPASRGWRRRDGSRASPTSSTSRSRAPSRSVPPRDAPDPRAKALMALQAMISSGVLVVVLARVINILPG